MLYNKDDYRASNKYEAKLDKKTKEILLNNHILLLPLLEDENDFVRYHVAGVLISLYPKECKRVLKEITKDKSSWYRVSSEYVIQTYEEGENYYQKFLEKHKSEIE